MHACDQEWHIDMLARGRSPVAVWEEACAWGSLRDALGLSDTRLDAHTRAHHHRSATRLDGGVGVGDGVRHTQSLLERVLRRLLFQLRPLYVRRCRIDASGGGGGKRHQQQAERRSG